MTALTTAIGILMTAAAVIATAAAVLAGAVAIYLVCEGIEWVLELGDE